jgi:pimeloyl-ACP methyl ester carboxylesterase
MPFAGRRTVNQAHGVVAYMEAGQGPPLMMLHGLGGNASTWAQQYRELGGERRVIGWDAPGYGASDPHPDPGADSYADAVAALLDALELEQVDLLGHSMGGVIAPRIVQRHPGRVRRLVLSATRASFAGESAEGFARRVEEFQTLTPEEFGQRRAESMVSSAAPAEVFQAVARVASEVRREGYLGGVTLLSHADNRALLPRLSLPTLVVAGEDDRVAPPEHSQEIAGLVPGARLEQLPGAAHAAYVEEAARYNALLRDFLS